MSKIAVISDIHGKIYALETILKDIEKQRGISEILCLGDVVGYYPYPNECIELIKEHCSITLMGNHDAGVIGYEPAFYFNPVAYEMILWTKKELSEKNMDWLTQLPKMRIIERDGKSIYMVHGTPFKIFDYFEAHSENSWMELLDRAFKKTLTDILLVGHTHIPVLRTFNEHLFLNPGSVGQPRNGKPGAYYAILTPKKMKAKLIRLDYDYRPLQKDMEKLKLPISLSERLALGR